MPVFIPNNHSNSGEFNFAADQGGGVSRVNLRSDSSLSFSAFRESGPSHFQNFDPTQLPGRPQLALPELSTINLIALLKEFQRTVSVSDVKVAMADARQLSYALDVFKSDRAIKTKEAQDSQMSIDEASKSKNLLNLIFGAIGLVVGVIALFLAVGALTALTGGAAAPAGIALASAVFGTIAAGFGSVMAAMTVANSIVQEVGVKRTDVFGDQVPVEISFAALVTLQMEAGVHSGQIKVVGVNAEPGTPGAKTKEEFKKMQEDAATAINITLAVVGLVLAVASAATGIAAFRAATQAAGAVEKAVETTSQIRSATHLAMAGGSVALAVGGLVSGGLGISLAIKKNDRAQTVIDEKTIEAAIQSLQQMFEANQQNFKNAMNFQETLRTAIASTMEIFYGMNTTIAKNTKI